MSRVKGVFKGAKKLFGSPKKKSAENKAPVNEIAVDEAVESHTDDAVSPTETLPVPESPEVTAETEAIDRDIVSLPEEAEDIYKDDNDGSENKCCEGGCVVM